VAIKANVPNTCLLAAIIFTAVISCCSLREIGSRTIETSKSFEQDRSCVARRF
jgi:hypothetical protein